MKKFIVFSLLLTLFFSCKSNEDESKIRVKALILPKYEIGNMVDNKIGEAELFYKEYFNGSYETYEIESLKDGSKIYVNDSGLALMIVGQGKINSSLTLFACLNDDRFDFSNTYIISVGSAASNVGYSTLGDVFIISSTSDYDMGHKVDARELKDSESATWFYDEKYKNIANKTLNKTLVDKVFNLVKDTSLTTTENTKKYMAENFPGETWATRNPKVLRGSSVTADDLWKGKYNRLNAYKIIETYKCPDPYAISESEDNAIAVVLDRFNLLDRFLIIRASVDTDIFMSGYSAESLWGGENFTLDSKYSLEKSDIFETSMRNNFKVAKILIDSILDGSFEDEYYRN